MNAYCLKQQATGFRDIHHEAIAIESMSHITYMLEAKMVPCLPNELACYII